MSDSLDDTDKARRRLNIVWEIVGILSVLTILITIRGYYLMSGEGGGSKTCVYADAEWEDDSRAFCTDDIPFAIEAVKQLNDTLR